MPTAILHWPLRSGDAHCEREVALEVRDAHSERELARREAAEEEEKQEKTPLIKASKQSGGPLCLPLGQTTHLWEGHLLLSKKGCICSTCVKGRHFGTRSFNHTETQMNV